MLDSDVGGLQEFAQNSNNMMQLCPKDQCCAYIGGGHQMWKPHFVNSHISDQSHCVFLPDGESIVDFIGTTENLAIDWTTVRSWHTAAPRTCPLTSECTET